MPQALLLLAKFAVVLLVGAAFFLLNERESRALQLTFVDALYFAAVRTTLKSTCRMCHPWL